MSEMSPEKLHVISAFMFGLGFENDMAKDVVAAADAWEADLKIIAYAQNDMAKQAIVIHELRERLEAAEQQIRDMTPLYLAALVAKPSEANTDQ